MGFIHVVMIDHAWGPCRLRGSGTLSSRNVRDFEFSRQVTIAHGTRVTVDPLPALDHPPSNLPRIPRSCDPNAHFIPESCSHRRFLPRRSDTPYGRRRFVAMTLDCAHAVGYRHHVTSTCDTALARFRAA